MLKVTQNPGCLGPWSTSLPFTPYNASTTSEKNLFYDIKYKQIILLMVAFFYNHMKKNKEEGSLKSYIYVKTWKNVGFSSIV